MGPVDNNVLRAALHARPATPCCSTRPTSTSGCSSCAERLGVRRVLETHGHWDHIQAVPRAARRRLLRGRHRRRRRHAAVLRRGHRGRLGDRGRPAAAAHHPHPRPHARARCASCSRATRCSSAATRSSPAVPATPRFEGGDFATIIESVDRRLFTLPADTHRAARPRRPHHDRHRAPAPPGVDRPGLVSVTDALPYHQRPDDDTPVHTADLPATPLRDRAIPATAWVEAPAALLGPRRRPARPAGGQLQAAHRPLAAVAGRPRHQGRRPLLGGPRRRPHRRPHLHPPPRRHRRRAPAPPAQVHQRFRTWKEDLRDTP